MGSRIMHYVVAQRVSEVIEIKDKSKFILGNLEPDLAVYEDGSYNISHFVEKNHEQGMKGFEWRKFANQYQEVILEDDEVLGYLVHLITDACWVKHVRQKYIRSYPKDERVNLTHKGYRDMYKYNSLLIHKYQLKNEIDEIKQLAVQEADIQYKEFLIKGLASDFSQPELEEAEFEVYPYHGIMEFIEMSVQRSITEIMALRMNLKLGNPEELYIPE